MGNITFAFYEAWKKRSADGVPIYMIVFCTDAKDGNFVTARFASLLAREWANKSITAGGPACARGDGE